MVFSAPWRAALRAPSSASSRWPAWAQRREEVPAQLSGPLRGVESRGVTAPVEAGDRSAPCGPTERVEVTGARSARHRPLSAPLNRSEAGVARACKSPAATLAACGARARRNSRGRLGISGAREDHPGQPAASLGPSCCFFCPPPLSRPSLLLLPPSRAHLSPRPPAPLALLCARSRPFLRAPPSTPTPPLLVLASLPPPQPASALPSSFPP